MVQLIPNSLTFLRLVLSVVVLGMIVYSPCVQRQALFLDVAFVLFVVAGLTDIVDGFVARRLNATSKFGRMTDPLVDKILVCGAFVCFAIVDQPKLFEWSPEYLAVVHWTVALILIAREAYVTALRHIAEARGVSFAATTSGKVKMFCQSFAIGTVLIKMAHFPRAEWASWFTLVVYAVMVVVTVVSGALATRRPSWRQLKA